MTDHRDYRDTPGCTAVLLTPTLAAEWLADGTVDVVACRQRAHRNRNQPEPVGRRTLSVAEAWIGLSELAAADQSRHNGGAPRPRARRTSGA